MKNWDAHVAQAELVARSPGFTALRDRIVDRSAAAEDDVVVDVGAGTGLLSLALAPSVRELWAVDISPSMCEYLRVKAASARVENIRTAVASADSLPLVDHCADLVVSNYCFHHLADDGKRHALAEVARVLRPGGRLVFGDMMFGLSIGDARDRQVVRDKVGALARRGPGGVARLARNAGRLATRRWEHPARATWWEQALGDAGFVAIDVEVLEHEGGLAIAHRPRRT